MIKNLINLFLEKMSNSMATLASFLKIDVEEIPKPMRKLR